VFHLEVIPLSTFPLFSLLRVLPVVKKGVWAGIEKLGRAWVFGATSSSSAYCSSQAA